MKDELIAGVTTVAGASLGSSITIATIPTVVTTTAPVWGPLSWLGVTTTTTAVVASPVTVPVAGVIAVGALLVYGGKKAYDYMKSQES